MLLEVQGVSKSYRVRGGLVQALDDVSIAVGAGECVGLIGESGSGKSTLASVIFGLERADAGVVTIQGVSAPADRLLARRPQVFREGLRDVRMVFQNPVASFSERMRIGRGVEEGVSYSGLGRRERRERMLMALEAVGLPASYEHKYPWELSGGECQRAAIARAIIARPQLLICDEPTSALDVTTQAQIIHLLHDLCDELGAACLFISHNLALVRGLCQRSYVLDAGRVVEEGSTQAVFEHPRSEAARRLVFHAHLSASSA